MNSLVFFCQNRNLRCRDPKKKKRKQRYWKHCNCTKDIVAVECSLGDISTCSTVFSDGNSADLNAQPEKTTIQAAKASLAKLEDEPRMQKKMEHELVELCEKDFSLADARRASGCRRGFLLTVRRMRNWQNRCVNMEKLFRSSKPSSCLFPNR